jgi:hypothetical protein
MSNLKIFQSNQLKLSNLTVLQNKARLCMKGQAAAKLENRFKNVLECRKGQKG